MSQQQRITSLAQLGEFKDEIATHPSADPLVTNASITQARTDRQQQRRNPGQKDMTNQNNSKFIPSKDAPVEDILRVIQERTRPVAPARQENPLPPLEDFILELQTHVFSFTLQNPNQLKRFVQQQRRENRFHRIAWSGGDEYMTALMIYVNHAVNAIVEARAPRPIVPKVPKQRPEKVVAKPDAAKPAVALETPVAETPAPEVLKETPSAPVGEGNADGNVG